MARCESIDVLRKAPLNLESSEGVSSDEVESVSSVLSVRCLQKGSLKEENDSFEYDTESHLIFINADDVPELIINTDKVENEELNLNHKPEDQDEKHPHLVPIMQKVTSSVSYALSHQPSSSVPARNNWDGAHNFKIKIGCGESFRKNENGIFSKEENKLYVAKDCPFKVLVSAENVPMGAVIKVTAVFALVEHSYEAVLRCPTHAQQDFVKGVAAFEHFVQSFSNLAIYERNQENGRLSVSVLYEKPQRGETYSSYLFRLTCYSSCNGGINRRPFMLMFTLEKDNIPLGRQTVEAKVCACPLRDYKIDTQKKISQTSENTINTNVNNNINNEEKDIESSQSDPDTSVAKYSITVKDPELFHFLTQMKVLYETGVYYSQIMKDT